MVHLNVTLDLHWQHKYQRISETSVSYGHKIDQTFIRFRVYWGRKRHSYVQLMGDSGATIQKNMKLSDMLGKYFVHKTYVSY